MAKEVVFTCHGDEGSCECESTEETRLSSLLRRGLRAGSFFCEVWARERGSRNVAFCLY